MTCTSTHSDYSFPTTGTIDENTLKLVSNSITDTDPLATNYTITLQQTNGNIGSWYINGNLVQSASTALVLSNTKSNINAANIALLPALESVSNVSISYSQTKTNSVFGNIVQASNVVANYSFGNTVPGITNMIDRSYTGNTINNIFSTSTPVIVDGTDVGQTYTITLSSTLGRFGNSAVNALAANSYSFTGNTTQCNAQFASMVFVPNYQTSSNGVFTYTQTRSGVLQASLTRALTGTAGSAITPVDLNISANTTYTPTIQEVAFGNWYVLSVAAGGGGTAGALTSGGGGAAGQVQMFNINQNTTIKPNAGTMSFVIGSAGQGAYNSVGGTGGNSYITWNSTTLFNSQGGQGGEVSVADPRLSVGGDNVVWPGGDGKVSGVDRDLNTAGGGAGNNPNSILGPGQDGSSGTFVTPTGGNGGYAWIYVPDGGLNDGISWSGVYFGGGGGGGGTSANGETSPNGISLGFGNGGQGRYNTTGGDGSPGRIEIRIR
jgi:hypothetical protein